MVVLGRFGTRMVAVKEMMVALVVVSCSSNASMMTTIVLVGGSVVRVLVWNGYQDLGYRCV